MSVDQLLRALQAGESDAEQRLFRRLHLELLRFFKKRVQPSDVEDLTQETLEIVAKTLRTKPFEPVGPTSFRSFVFVVAHYRLWTYRKSSRRQHHALPLMSNFWDMPEPASPSKGPDENTTIQQQSALLHEAMAAITSRYRRALESRLRDEDPREFADAEGIELGTVRTRIFRAMALVSAKIEARRRTTRGSTPT